MKGNKMKTVAIKADHSNKTFSITCRDVDRCSSWYIDGNRLKARRTPEVANPWDGEVMINQGVDNDAEACKHTLQLMYRGLGYTQITIIEAEVD
jgi:hypothetical protein